jgi:hypothetical protein
MLTSCRSDRRINRIDTVKTLNTEETLVGSGETSGKTTLPSSDTASSKTPSYFTAPEPEGDAASVHTDPTPQKPEDPKAKEKEKEKQVIQEELNKDFIKAIMSVAISTGIYAAVDTTDKYSHLCDDPYIHLLST